MSLQSFKPERELTINLTKPLNKGLYVHSLHKKKTFQAFSRSHNAAARTLIRAKFAH